MACIEIKIISGKISSNITKPEVLPNKQIFSQTYVQLCNMLTVCDV